MKRSQQELFLCLVALWAEYRRQLGLNLGFLFTLVLACATLMTVLMLNDASKTEYHRATNQLESPIAYYIVGKDGQGLSQQDFAYFRQQGFWQVSPVKSFTKKLNNGKSVKIVALDLLPFVVTASPSMTLSHAFVSQAYAEHTGIIGSELDLADGNTLPLFYSETLSFGRAVAIDISVQQQHFPDIKHFSYLIVPELNHQALITLRKIMPVHLMLQQQATVEERQGFASALHHNLNVLAVMGFAVCLFIAFQAAQQAWAERKLFYRQLATLGVAKNLLSQVIAIEASVLVVLSAGGGLAIAVFLTVLLLPLMGLSLAQLFNLNISGSLEFQWIYVVGALFVSSIAVIAAIASQWSSILFELERTETTKISRVKGYLFYKVFAGKRWGLALSMVTTLSGIYALINANNWLAQMLFFSWLMLIALLLLPQALSAGLSLADNYSRSRQYVNVKHMIVDARISFNKRLIPLAAFFLALTVGLAASFMVYSFQQAFVDYLEQHLNEDLFIRLGQYSANELRESLLQHPDVLAINIYQSGSVTINQQRVALRSVSSPRQFSSIVLKAATISHYQQLITDESHCYCLINEQLSFQHGLSLRDVIELSADGQHFSCAVAGIYYDYGTQGNEITLLAEDITRLALPIGASGLGLYLRPNKQDEVIGYLAARFNLAQDLIFKPAQVKGIAIKVFEQTFIITRSIAVVLLFIACFGLFLSVRQLELSRKRELFTLRALGYSRMMLFRHILAQWLLQALIIIVYALPVAIILAYGLVNHILPASFGWSMPLVFSIEHYLLIALSALFCLSISVIIPLLQLKVEHGNVC